MTEKRQISLIKYLIAISVYYYLPRPTMEGLSDTWNNIINTRSIFVSFFITIFLYLLFKKRYKNKYQKVDLISVLIFGYSVYFVSTLVFHLIVPYLVSHNF
ncbi:hypothetical protein IGI37_000440 [Enterococcus sp. AZ194]